jgi:hypothetical protein
MKNAVFWVVAPCRCGRLNRRFGGSYRLHLQGRQKNPRAKNQREQVAAGGDVDSYVIIRTLLSIYLSGCLSVCLSVVSVHLSIYLSIYLAI